MIVGTLSTEKDGGVTFDSKNFVATIPDKFGGDKIKTGTEYQMKLKIDKLPDDANPIAQAIGNVVYFKDEDSTKVSAQKQGDNNVVLTFPMAYQAAYPAMKDKAKFKVKIKYKYDEKGTDKENEEHDLDCAINLSTLQCTIAASQKIKTLSDVAIEDGSDKYPKTVIK